jgi:hypothetical protein
MRRKQVHEENGKKEILKVIYSTENGSEDKWCELINEILLRLAYAKG